MENNIKNDRQLYWNQIKGAITELNDGEQYCSITIKVGHENLRDVNVSLKKEQWNEIINQVYIGCRVVVKFFVVSRKKFERWHTSANMIELKVDTGNIEEY